MTVRAGLNRPSGYPPAIPCSADQATASASPEPGGTSGKGLGVPGVGRSARRQSQLTTWPRVTERPGRNVWFGYPPTIPCSEAHVAASSANEPGRRSV